MSKFEKLTPAFQSETLAQHREDARPQETGEMGEIDKAQKFSKLVKAMDQLDANGEPESQWVDENLGADKTPAYHEDEGAALHVGLKLKYDNSGFEDPYLLINGRFQGTNSSSVFDVYKVTDKGELFRADPDNHSPDEDGYWKKISLTAQKDARRVAEAEQMLKSILGDGEIMAREESSEAKIQRRAKEDELKELTQEEMAGDTKAFAELDKKLRNAVELKQRRVRTPAQSLIFHAERATMAKELEGYGIDFSLTSQLEGLAEATNQTMEAYIKLSTEFAEAEDHTRRAENLKQTITGLNQLI